MSTIGLSFPETGAVDRSQEIHRCLRQLGRRGWWLWGYAALIILSLTAAVVVLSISELAKPDEPFFQFHISQAVHGLIGVVLLFNVYTVYQQVQLNRLHLRAEEFLKLAMLDPLTGLHNRRFAQERLAGDIARAQRHGHALTALLLDVDDFKQLNDRYGHLIGDLALKEFAHRLTRAIRGSDLAVRIGGDEFLVILPECQFGQVQHVLGRLRPLGIDVDGKKVSFTCSAGWADHQPGERPEELLKRADAALYIQKHQKTSSSAAVAPSATMRVSLTDTH